MGVELVRKYGNIAMTSFYISALRHPFLVVMVIHLIWMYRSFPFLFSLLVYASPVIVSTAVLLGTLLFFGHQNLPPKPHHHHIHINRKTVVMGDTEVDESSSCEETHSSSKVLENTFKGKTCVVNNNNNIKVNVDHSNNNNIIHIDKKGSSVDDSDSKQSRKETKNIVDNQEKNKNVGGEKVVLLDHFSQHNLLPDAAKNSKLKSSDKLQGNSLLWQCGEKHKKDEDNKGWETGSELAESSSPSALMADIFPMLAQVPQHTHLSNVGTDVASDHSLDSTDVINETDDDDDDDDEEDIQVKDDEEEEEEEANMETEDETTWTENDQKNLLVNLGTSEVERNQRLETLIARQRALKNMRIMAEKNMVNLSPDIPFNATLTTRKNPLGLPYDPNAHILGPPSSVTRNHPSGEKQPDTQEPNLHNESCDVVDPSTSHYSVHERMVAPDYSSSMHRQTSEVSDSKVSSTPDTESTVDSADDLENKNHTKYDFSREADLTCVKDHYHTTKESEHVNRSSSDDDTEDGRLDEVKTSVMDEADNQEKTSSNWSSSPLSDVTDHVYDEKEGEKTLESNYHTENSHKIQMDISKRHQSPPTTTTRYVEYQQHEAVPDDNKEQQKESSHDHKGIYEEKIISRPEELSLTADDKSTRYAGDHNEVVPDNKQVQQSTVKTYSHDHKGTSEENNNNITSQPEEMSRSMDKPARRYDEVQNMVVPDNKQQSSASSSHYKGKFEEKSIDRRNANEADNKEQQSIHDKPTEYQNEVVPDDNNKDQKSTSSSHHNATHEENIIIISQPDELSLEKRSLDKPEEVRYDEDQNVVIPDNKQVQQSSTTIMASSHHNGTSEEELYLTADKTTRRNAEDQHLIAPDNNNNKKEQQPTVTSPPHNATQPEEMSLENPLTHDSNEELQIQEQQVSPNNNSASSTFEDKISSGMGTNTPASPEYESNVNRIDSNHEKNDDISDIGDSSVYESGFDSDTDRSENANTEFASASESEMSRTNESRFPQRLSRVQQDLTSWLTGWRV